MKTQIKEHVGLSRKIMAVYVVTLIIEILFFILSLSFAMRNVKKEATYSLISSRLRYATVVAQHYGITQTQNLVGDEEQTDIIELYISDEFDNGYIVEPEFIARYMSEEELKEFISKIKKDEFNKKGYFSSDKGNVYFEYVFINDEANSIIVASSTGEFFNESIAKNVINILILFFAIFTVGALTVFFYLRSVVKRINKLCDFVASMPQKAYRESYLDDGDDEIEMLSVKVEGMRETIIADEINKNLMLQNISHDLKTPIAVIRSYAEAIGDGIETVDKTEIIINQANKLEKKVRNLIQFNKLEYILSTGDLEEVLMQLIIEEVVENCKYISNLEFNVSVDDTVFIGKYENYFIVVENIVDNAMRYAKSKINITLKDGTLTIYNDGEHISDDFVKNGFRPYEKGHQGKFGLGMSIVAKTLMYFGMDLIVKNEEKGVSFIIKKK